MKTEILIGGICDGMEVPADDRDMFTYAGYKGDGNINVYVRNHDDRLHYFDTFSARHKDLRCNKCGKWEKVPSYLVGITCTECTQKQFSNEELAKLKNVIEKRRQDG